MTEPRRQGTPPDEPGPPARYDIDFGPDGIARGLRWVESLGPFPVPSLPSEEPTRE